MLRDACITISIRSLFAVVPDICGPFHQLIWSSLCRAECSFAGYFCVSVLDCALFRPLVKVSLVILKDLRYRLKGRFLALKGEEV